MLTLLFPAFDPVLLHLGPIAVRWYGLAYVVGVLLGWHWIRRLLRKPPQPSFTEEQIDGFLTFAILGIVIGGRLGYILLYKPDIISTDFFRIFAVWEGGMSFHGGLAGIILATLFYCRRQKIAFLRFSDLLVCAAPIGLFFGRLANFINGELFGRPTDAPWGVIFPYGGGIARHPSQLYEAILEGIVLFVLLNCLRRSPPLVEKSGRLSGIFLLSYGLLRFGVEFFREPDAHLGFFLDFLTIGQLYSLPLILFGIYFVFWYNASSHPSRSQAL